MDIRSVTWERFLRRLTSGRSRLGLPCFDAILKVDSNSVGTVGWRVVFNGCCRTQVLRLVEQAFATDHFAGIDQMVSRGPKLAASVPMHYGDLARPHTQGFTD